MFTFIDLFCGIGGFHQALSNLGGTCVFASDIDQKCRDIYEKNYNLKPEGDIKKNSTRVLIPHHDVLCAGFPCQPFSKAGFQNGFDDDRGNLFFEICKIVDKHKPKYLILENVKNLASHDDGNTWNVIKISIDYLGYYTYEEPVILNAMHFGVPQHRERVIIMCKRKDLGELPKLPNISKRPKVNNLKDYIISGEPNLNDKMKEVEKVWNEFLKLKFGNIPKFPIWTDWWDKNPIDDPPFYKKYTNWIDKNQNFFKENRIVLEPWLLKSRNNIHWKGAVRKFEWQAGDLRKNDSMNTVLWSARGSGIRTKRPDYIPTLVAMSQTPVYGPESRTLSPRELLRLQSFPDSFKFQEDNSSIFKQIGNAVSVKMIQGCARFLMFEQQMIEGY